MDFFEGVFSKKAAERLSQVFTDLFMGNQSETTATAPHMSMSIKASAEDIRSLDDVDEAWILLQQLLINANLELISKLNELMKNAAAENPDGFCIRITEKINVSIEQSTAAFGKIPSCISSDSFLSGWDTYDASADPMPEDGRIIIVGIPVPVPSGIMVVSRPCWECPFASL